MDRDDHEEEVRLKADTPTELPGPPEGGHYDRMPGPPEGGHYGGFRGQGGKNRNNRGNSDHSCLVIHHPATELSREI